MILGTRSGKQICYLQYLLMTKSYKELNKKKKYTTWMDLEIVILSEVIQTKKDVWHPLYVESKKK